MLRLVYHIVWNQNTHPLGYPPSIVFSAQTAVPRRARGTLLYRCRPRFEASISVDRVGRWSKHLSSHAVDYLNSHKCIPHSNADDLELQPIPLN